MKGTKLTPEELGGPLNHLQFAFVCLLSGPVAATFIILAVKYADLVELFFNNLMKSWL